MEIKIKMTLPQNWLQKWPHKWLQIDPPIRGDKTLRFRDIGLSYSGCGLEAIFKDMCVDGWLERCPRPLWRNFHANVGNPPVHCGEPSSPLWSCGSWGSWWFDHMCIIWWSGGHDAGIIWCVHDDLVITMLISYDDVVIMMVVSYVYDRGFVFAHLCK